MVFPDTQAPPVQPDYGHGGLINQVYHAIKAHPNPTRMAEYAKILTALLSSQAKDHAAGNAHGQQGDGSGAPGQQAGQVIQTLQGGAGGGPSFYGQPMPPQAPVGGQDPIFEALAARQHAAQPVAPDGWAIPRLMGHRGY